MFAKLNQELVRRAVELGLVDPTGLATDSMRLRADASMKQIRTKVRSEARLKELAAVSEDQLDGEQLKRHREKVEKHRSAVESCGKTGRTNYLITNPAAGLMKFPNGASMPGHRITVTAAGTRFRFILSAQVGFEPTDHGLLGPAVQATREALVGTRLQDAKLQVAADPGYIGPVDLAFALENRANVDILIHDPPEPRRGKDIVEGGMYSRDEFTLNEDGTAVCPAGKPMWATPHKPGAIKRVWRGVGCTECPVKKHCTTTKSRRITMNIEREALHEAMRVRMALPGAKARYNKRIAIIEPVFSYLEDTMRYVRATSRLERTVRSEVSMKILAYNLVRFLLHVWIFLSYGCTRTAAWLEAELRAWMGGERDGGRAERAAGAWQTAAVLSAA